LSRRGTAWRKHKLRKKLYIINDCLAVGLTGELTALARFLQALRARFPLSATHSEIEDFLADYDQPASSGRLAVARGHWWTRSNG